MPPARDRSGDNSGKEKQQDTRRKGSSACGGCGPTPRPGQLRVDVGQRGVVEDVGRRVADLLHRETDAAGLFGEAFGAGAVGRRADARHGRERAVEGAVTLEGERGEAEALAGELLETLREAA